MLQCKIELHFSNAGMIFRAANRETTPNEPPAIRRELTGLFAFGDWREALISSDE